MILDVIIIVSVMVLSVAVSAIISYLIAFGIMALLRKIRRRK